MDGNLKQKMLLHAQQSGQSVVSLFLVAHEVTHPATSMHVMMHHDSSPIDINTTTAWQLMMTSSPIPAVLIGDKTNDRWFSK